MTELIKIAVDAMGGDNSPNKTIDGVILNHKSNKNLFYKIFGDENKIRNLIGLLQKEGYTITTFAQLKKELF